MKRLENFLKGLGLSEPSIEEIKEATLIDIKEEYRNIHVIEAKYIGATNTHGSRIKLSSALFKQSIYISHNSSSYKYTIDVAIDWLNKNGFEVFNSGEGKEKHYINCLTFKPIK